MLRKVAVAAASKPHVEIRQDGDQFYIKTSTTVRTTEINFKVGEGFEEETVDGRKCRVRPQRRAAFRGPLLRAAARRAPACLRGGWCASPARPCTGGLQRGFVRAGCPGLGTRSSAVRPHPTQAAASALRLEGRGTPAAAASAVGAGAAAGGGCGARAAATSPVAGGTAALASPRPPVPGSPGPRGRPGSGFSGLAGQHLSLRPSAWFLKERRSPSQSEADSGWGDGPRALSVLKRESVCLCGARPQGWTVDGMDSGRKPAAGHARLPWQKSLLVEQNEGSVSVYSEGRWKIVAAAISYLKGDKMSPSLSPAFKTKKHE